MTTRIKLRRDTASNWTDANPVLALAEPGLETDTRKVKYGDGTTAWQDLPYSSAGVDIGNDGQIIIGEGTTTDGGSNSIAIGTQAGIGQMWSTVAIGNNAGNTDQGASAIAIGRSAGNENQDWDAIAIGRRAGQTDQQEGTIAVGYYAGKSNQRYHSIAIGSQAGETNQYWDAIAIGKGAGNDGQDHQTIAIGHRAGETEQNAQSVAIGTYAGNNNQGQHAIAIGAQAGNDSQGWTAVAIGEDAGNENQGFRGVGIGRYAGGYNQGQQSVAVGALAGYSDQGEYSVAIGRHAGEGSQGNYAIAIGQEAGRGSNPDTVESVVTANWVSGGTTGNVTMVLDTVNNVYPGMFIGGYGLNGLVTDVNQGTNTVTFDSATSADASGEYVFFGSQGEYAIAIGAYAADVVQHDHSIVLNATGNSLVSASSNSFVVKPVRGDTTSLGMHYNTTTGEITYGTKSILTTVTTTGSQDVAYPTALDLTKSVNKLSDNFTSRYTLADGVEGQVMYLVRQRTVTDLTLSSIGIVVANMYSGLNVGTNQTLYFGDDMITLLFTDGAWQQTGGIWD